MPDWIWGQSGEELSSRFPVELAETRRLLRKGGLDGAESLGEMAEKVRASYGKPLYIEPAVRLGGLAGLYQDFGDRGKIRYHDLDARPHQMFTICHELMHALGKHEGCTVLSAEVKHLVEEEGVALAAVRGHGAEIDFEEIVAELGAHRMMWQIMHGRLPRAGRRFR
jgi:hypothetical protein